MLTKIIRFKWLSWLCVTVLILSLPVLGLSATTLALNDVTSSQTICLTGDEIIWEAQASGGEGVKTYQYELYKNDGIDPVYTRAYNNYTEFKFKPTSSGTYYVVCTVKDGTGTAYKESDEVVVRNPLALSSVTADKSSGYTGKTVTWTASASYGYGTKTYCFQLYKNDALVNTSAYSTDNSFVYTPTDTGTYHVVCTVEDASGSTSKTSADVNIYKQLLLNTLTGSRTICMIGDTITWSATSSDGHGAKTYQYQLYRDDTLIYTRAYSSYPKFNYVPSADGAYRVVCTVKDSLGSVSKTSANVTVRKTVGLSGVNASRTLCLTGETITWTARYTNGLGAKTYQFKLYRNSALVYTRAHSSSSFFRYVPTNSGTYSVVCTVQDSSGTATMTGSSVVVRKPLNLYSLTVDKSACMINEIITWAAAASDGYGTKTYQFKLYKDDALIYTRAYSTYPKLYFKPSTDGSYHVVCTVKDASGDVSKTSADVTVNKPVTLSSVKANRTLCLINETITWAANATDGTGDKTYEFKLYRDGVLIYTRPFSAENELAYPPSDDGTYNVVCTVKDTSGTSEKASANVIVRKPVIVDITGTGGHYVGTTYTWTGSCCYGIGPRTFQFKLLKDDTVIYTRDYSTDPSFSYEFSSTGIYRVICYVKDSVSEANRVSGTWTVQYRPLGVPQNFHAASVEKESVTLEWDAVPGATHYRFYFEGSFLTTVTGTSYTCTGLTPNAKYKFKVSAADSLGRVSEYTDSLLIQTLNNATYRACLIGQNDYWHVNPLYGGINDATNMQMMLNNLTMQGKSYQVHRYSNQTASQIIADIYSAFSGATEDDVSLFYYSGHGVIDDGAFSGALCGVDCSSSSLSGFVSPTQLRSALSSIPGTIIIILDSSASGSYITRRDSGAPESSEPETYDPNNFNRAIINAFTGPTIRFGEFLDYKYKVLTATSYDQPSVDILYPPDTVYGKFTTALVNGGGLSVPGGAKTPMYADKNSDNIVTVQEAYWYIQSRSRVMVYGISHDLFRRD